MDAHGRRFNDLIKEIINTFIAPSTVLSDAYTNTKSNSPPHPPEIPSHPAPKPPLYERTAPLAPESYVAKKLSEDLLKLGRKEEATNTKNKSSSGTVHCPSNPQTRKISLNGPCEKK